MSNQQFYLMLSAQFFFLMLVAGLLTVKTDDLHSKLGWGLSAFLSLCLSVLTGLIGGL